MGLFRFSAGFGLLSLIAWALYVTIFILQLGARTAAEYWIYDAKIVKLHLMDAQAERRRVIFLGGSSLWFGIDSGLVEQTLGVQSFNLGLHAMYPLGQIVNEVRPAIRPGDVIIMPLEFEYYTIDTAYNPWYLNQVMVGAPEIFWASSWQEKISFMISVPPMRVLEGITTRMFSGPEGRVSKRQIGQSSDQVMTLMRQAWDKGSEPEEVYTFRNIDPRGDAIVSRGSYISYVYPISMDTVAHAYPWQVLASFAQYCARHSVDLYIGWPPVVKGEIAFDSKLVKNNVRVISQRLAELGIPVLGNLPDFQYDRPLFSDSAYHLKHEGRTLHTKHMLQLIGEKMHHLPCGDRFKPCQTSDQGAGGVGVAR